MSNIFLLLFALEMGIIPMNNFVPSDSTTIIATEGYYINLDIELIAYDHFFIGGYNETYMINNIENYTFNPLQMTYGFRTGFRLEPFEVGYKHICGPHPVDTYAQFKESEYKAPFEGSYDKFYIKITGRY